MPEVRAETRHGRGRALLSRLSISAKIETVRLLPAIGPGLTWALGTTVVVGGLLPAAIIGATGALIGSIPATLEHGLASSAARTTWLALTALGVMFVLLQWVGALRLGVGNILGRRLDRRLEERVMRAVMAPAGIGHVEDRATLDAIAAALGIATGGYRPAEAVPALANKATSWLQGAASAAILAAYSWWLAILLLAAWAWAAQHDYRRYVRTSRVLANRATDMRRAEYLRDLVLVPAAAKEVRVFGLTDWLAGRSDAETRRVFVEAGETRRRPHTQEWLSILAASGVTLGVLVRLALDGAHADIGVGALSLFVGATLGVRSVVHQGLDNSLIEYGTAAVPAVRAVERMLSVEPDSTMDADAGVPPGDRASVPDGDLELRGVHFTYPHATSPTLDGLDLHIPEGRSLAIVGANGAGKTTLLKLLCRFHEPQGGAILAGGAPLTSVDARAWQRNVAAVFQDFVRYPLPAAVNIALAAGPDAAWSEDATIVEAARRAGARELIEGLPSGFATVLSPAQPGGIDLSGGQWQRIVLARALHGVAGGARILILDEPTANLDVRAEAELYDRFLEITAGKTAIIVSHRFSTVRRADLIAVLARGRIVEKGTHEELLAAGGRYARMYRLQAVALAPDEPSGAAGPTDG